MAVKGSLLNTCAQAVPARFAPLAENKSRMNEIGAIAPRTLQLAGQIIEIARSEGVAPGDRLYEHRLAQRLGISRGRVRAALQARAEAGLAETIPNRGYVLIKPLDSEAAKST